MSVAKGAQQMAAETEQKEALDDGIEVVLDDDVQITLDDGGELDVVIAVASTAVVDDDVDVAHRPVVEVVVVEDAYLTPDHADLPQVFASAVRLRPLFAAMSLLAMLCVALAVYGLSVIIST